MLNCIAERTNERATNKAQRRRRNSEGKKSVICLSKNTWHVCVSVCVLYTKTHHKYCVFFFLRMAAIQRRMHCVRDCVAMQFLFNLLPMANALLLRVLYWYTRQREKKRNFRIFFFSLTLFDIFSIRVHALLCTHTNSNHVKMNKEKAACTT